MLPGEALAVPFLLPEGEPASRWQSALALAGASDLDPGEPRVHGQPWVELQRTASSERWRLRVRDHLGGLHEIEVRPPTLERQREELVVLAASLLHPVAGGSDFWSGLAAEHPPPLPERPPPLPAQPPPLPARAPPLPAETVRAAELEPPPLPAERLAAAPEQLALSPDEPPPPAPEEERAASIAAVASSPAAPAPPEPRFREADRPGWLPWAALDTSLDARAGQVRSAFGGGFQVGVAAPWGLRVGLGLLAETWHALDFELEQAPTQRALRESDLFLGAAWTGPARIAPHAALRLGESIRSLERDGELVDQSLVPFAGLEAGLSLGLGSSLALVPFGRAQLDLWPSATLGLEGREVDGEVVYTSTTQLARWSAHLGISLHVRPAVRPR